MNMNKLNIVITAGGTTEHIDAVRAITNTGTGTLASIIANKFVNSIFLNKIFYIHTKGAKLPKKTDQIEFIEVEDTESVKQAVVKVLTENKIDWFIHAMAISDYYVDFVTTVDNLFNVNAVSVNDFYGKAKETKLDNSKKLSSNEDNLVVMLKKTPKIISLIKETSPETHLVGFKLLNNVTKDELIDVAYNLLVKNSCDYVVANDSTQITQNMHIAHIINAKKEYTTVATNDAIAQALQHIIF